MRIIDQTKPAWIYFPGLYPSVLRSNFHLLLKKHKDFAPNFYFGSNFLLVFLFKGKSMFNQLNKSLN